MADIAYWNNNAGRWVKRGAHGIAVFDTRANSSRLRYLFDISDTIPAQRFPKRCRGSLQTRTGGLFGIKS
ncbi:hypothetical protein NIA69_06670 [Gemmiger formicilis]|nr:hypothetical protein [Gemmiger formicilis]